MLTIIISVCVLMAATVAVHTSGLAVLLRVLRLHDPPPMGVWPVIRLLLRIFWLLVGRITRCAPPFSAPSPRW